MDSRNSTMVDGNMPSFTLPLTALTYSKPDEEITEAEKFKNDGEFFARMNRWITLNFFNQNIPCIAGGTRIDVRACEEVQTNFDFYFGIQQNKTFSYTETIDEDSTIQAVYNPDQKIRQIVDHAIGNSIKMIQPIKDSISAKLLSKDAIKGREQLRKKLILKQKLDALIGEVPGVTFAPAGVESIGEDEDIDDILNEFKQNEELDFIKLAQSIFYNNNLSKKFENSAFHQFVANISNFLIDVVDGKTEVTFIQSGNSIIDYRATDDFLSDALVGGGVQFLSPAEIFSKWGNELSEEQKDHINKMSQRAYSNWLECYNYYNAGCENNYWWWQNNGKVTCSTTYWIGKKNLPYRKKKTAFGTQKIQFLNDNDQYHVYDENGKQIMDNGKPVLKKGNDIKTEGIWAVHKCTNIGNYCTVNKGYHPLQIRPQGQKQKPLLPTVTFVHRLTMGYYRSVVSRLRNYAEERGRLKLKIQELTGRDMGKVYVLFASKLGLTEDQAKEAFKDFKTMGFTLINDLGENGADNPSVTADALDFSLQPSISAYITLWKEEAAEMEAIVSTSSIAMGQQTRTIGKGVQEQSISQSTLGQLSLYDGLMEHWRRVLQYSLNCEKVLKAGKETLIQTDSNEAYLINLNKNVMWEELGLYIEPSDALDSEEQQILKDGLFAFGQNGGTLEAAEALLNTMELINFNSKAEGVEHLRTFVEKKKKEVIAMQAQQQQAAMQQSAGDINLSKLWDAKLLETKEENANYRTEITAALAAISKMHSEYEKSSAQLIQTLSQMQPVTPVAQEIAASQQSQ